MVFAYYEKGNLNEAFQLCFLVGIVAVLRWGLYQDRFGGAEVGPSGNAGMD